MGCNDGGTGPLMRTSELRGSALGCLEDISRFVDALRGSIPPFPFSVISDKAPLRLLLNVIVANRLARVESSSVLCDLESWFWIVSPSLSSSQKLPCSHRSSRRERCVALSRYLDLPICCCRRRGAMMAAA